jgi:hypothetical protein
MLVRLDRCVFFLWREAGLDWLCVRIVWIAATNGLIELSPGVPGLITAGGRIYRQAKPRRSMIIEPMRGISCSVAPSSICRLPVAARQASPLQGGTISGPSRSIPLPLSSASTSQRPYMFPALQNPNIQSLTPPSQPSPSPTSSTL